MEEKQSKSIAKIIPTKLMTLFISGSVISLFIILVLLYFGMITLFKINFISEAQKDSISVGSTLMLIDEKTLINMDALSNKTSQQIKQTQLFDKRIRHHLSSFGVIKIKIFNTDNKIVYSTDKKIIGMVDTDNKRLNMALSGKVIPHYTKSGQFTDLKNETKFNVDVVETYLPIYTKANKIIGAYEVYLDVTQFRETADNFAYFTTGIIGFLLLLSFFFLYLLMRRGVKQINVYEGVLSEMAIRDPLTGLLNRRELMARAEEEFVRAKRILRQGKTGIRLGLMMLDIDFFKKINDEYGHLAGDQILKELFERIKISLRQYDIFGRYGGEEFLILLQEADCKTITEVSERILHSIRSTPFIYQDKKIHVTISIGFSTVNPDDENIQATIARSDEALYKAKELGRDQYQQDSKCCSNP